MRAIGVAALGLIVLASVPLASQRATPRGSPAPRRATPARTESAVPFHVGETMTYDVSWSSFIVAGTAVASVKEKKPAGNSTAYYVVVEGRPVPLVARLYSVYYKMDSLIDAYGLLSQRGTLYSEEGTDRRTTTTRFDRAARRAFFEQRTDTTVVGDFAVPPQTQDGLAAFYSLRARTFKAGDHLTIPVADSGALYTTTIDVGAPESVKVPFGEMSAWRLTLGIRDAANQPVWKDLMIWMSTDARHLPVKMQAALPLGSFVFTLRDVR
jgi:hypothetical protein